ncbi:hypothetical protein [Pseudobacteriovorax antillogorgiicola]|uniref:Carbohydrate/starch-binding module (Family 21) n=1 Tax=Pseudobacteriovorax antillogorgiicola TaxID=1513793 RepID=A0A1Y6CP00_9BACT|nr:hypothetical protein [Pseudobacteriovorax antillogorgiicola]TCS43621.1 carbohydrate/starch-binding protein with CBM21 domain [Pseudobacteriovorax antillogorgiicola]SMF80027.1 Carbohydrate/starch-binding module (family 21) [Pseudobacteriovorax antillogorgiicola]
MSRFILVILGVFWTTSVSFGANEVRLLKAFSSVGAKYGVAWQNAYLEILVKDIAYDKAVGVRLKDCEGQWRDVPAAYDRSVGNQMEIWRINGLTADFPIDEQAANDHQKQICDLEFALYYRVNELAFWDNNRGQNYTLFKSEGMMMGPDLLSDGAQLYASLHGDSAFFSGRIHLRNLAPHKSVKVIYSRDGWQSQDEVKATYQYQQHYGYSNVPSPNVYGVEFWSFDLRVPPCSQLEYYLIYEVDGQEIVDDNWGNRYQVAVQ